MAAYTQTRTYTRTDVKRVFESCMADIRMIAWRTQAIEEGKATALLADVQIMAEENCLKKVHVQLRDANGAIVKAHVYTATDGGGTSERPGGNQWPREPTGEVRIIVEVEPDARWEKAQERMTESWGASNYSTDYGSLHAAGVRTFSYGGYGLTRVSYE